jgi:hypothetical protein
MSKKKTEQKDFASTYDIDMMYRNIFIDIF